MLTVYSAVALFTS